MISDLWMQIRINVSLLFGPGTPRELPREDDICIFSVHRTSTRILRAGLGFSSPITLLGIRDGPVSMCV